MSCIFWLLPIIRSDGSRSELARSLRTSEASDWYSKTRSNAVQDIVELERLGEVVVGAELGRLDRGSRPTRRRSSSGPAPSGPGR